MREVELFLVNDTDKCAIYTVGGVKNSQHTSKMTRYEDMS